MPHGHLYNEKEVLKRIAKGDENAFQELHHYYWNEVYSFAVAFLKSPQAAEDIVQDVFVKLWLKKEMLPAVEKFRSFLLVSTRNELISALRRFVTLQKHEEAFFQSIQESGDPGNFIDMKETAVLIREAVAELPPQQQTIFRMSRDEHLNHEDIAQKLGLSKKTVSNTITIVLGHIRSYLYRKGSMILGIFLC